MFFLAIFLLATIFLTLFRLGFLLKCLTLADGISFFALLCSFAIGLRFDIMVLSYILISLFILSFAPLIRIDRFKPARIVIETILLVCLSLVFFLTLMDLEYFAEFGTRLSHWALEYLNQPEVIWHAMWSGYPVIFYLLLWTAVTSVFAFLLTKKGGRIFRRRQKERVLLRIAYFVTVVALLSLGARGRWHLGPIDWGLLKSRPFSAAESLMMGLA